VYDCRLGVTVEVDNPAKLFEVMVLESVKKKYVTEIANDRIYNLSISTVFISETDDSLEEWPCNVIVKDISGKKLVSRVRAQIHIEWCNHSAEEIVRWYKIDALKNVWRVTSNITKGGLIERSSVTKVQINHFDYHFKDYRDINPVGFRTLRALKKGDYVSDIYLVNDHDVNYGDVVTILLAGKNYRIESSGIAKSAGNSGDMIEIQLAHTKEPITAKVKEKGLVIYE
jgi:flagella basal body P-ring formation protein FlgA